MKDQFNRTINYARISLTSACNECCVYCRRPEDARKPGTSGYKSVEDYILLAKALAAAGISKIKLTGGEPSLYPDLAELIRELYTIPGIEQVTLTTNGLHLEKQLEDLYSAGLRDITFSIDTLDQDLYRRITGVDGLDSVLKTLQKASDLGMKVKVNCVPFNMNKDTWPDVASLAKDSDISVRFIEMMPVGLGALFKPVSGNQILSELEKKYNAFLEPEDPGIKRGNGPAKYYQFPGWKGSIGLISAMSDSFCQDCSRIRINEDFKLIPCLNAEYGVDLKTALESRNEPELLEKIKTGIWNKPEKHDFETRAQNMRMHEIGG